MARAIRVLVTCREDGETRTYTYYPEQKSANLSDAELLLWARAAFESEADDLERDIPTIARPTFLSAEVSR